jgi:hypothetical protein
MMKKLIIILMIVLFLGSFFYVFTGASMHRKVRTEENLFHDLQTEYFSLSKAERDAALTGSDLNENLVSIQQYPSELLRLKLVGIGKILMGIYLLLFGILIALMMMPIRLGMIIKNK